MREWATALHPDNSGSRELSVALWNCLWLGQFLVWDHFRHAILYVACVLPSGADNRKKNTANFLLGPEQPQAVVILQKDLVGDILEHYACPHL